MSNWHLNQNLRHEKDLIRGNKVVGNVHDSRHKEQVHVMTLR